jgi:hypothetical protein
MTRWIVTAALTYAVGVGPVLGQTQAQTTPPPVPRPFPGTTQAPPPGAKPAPGTATVAGGATDGSTVDPLLAGIPLYPGVELLMTTELRHTSQGARVQRLFVFGTNDGYAGIVNFYKSFLKRNGEEVSRVPAIQQFDLGSFDADTMAQRPSVIVKDYTWPEPQGYLHADGKIEKRFKSLVQIIPPAR